MRFAVALLALASAVAAQTVGFDVVQKPTENESVPAGAAYTIEWTSSPQDKGTVSLTLLAGSSPQSLQVLELLKTGVDSTGGKYSWDVPSTLPEKSVYGIKISLDADPSTFQYSFPFRVVGSTPGKAAAATAASSTAAAASTSASATRSTSTSTSTSTSSVASSSSSSSTSTAAFTSAVAPVSSAPPASSVQTYPKTSTLVTSTKTTATGTGTGRTTATVATTTATAAPTTATASSSSTVSATPSAIKTSGGVAGQTVSLATLLFGLAVAYATL